jgi:hypothetical protein
MLPSIPSNGHVNSCLIIPQNLFLFLAESGKFLYVPSADIFVVHTGIYVRDAFS